MKTKLIITLIIMAFTISFSGCSKKSFEKDGGIKATIGFDSTAITPAAFNEIFSIITKRIEKLDLKGYEISKNAQTNEISVTLPGFYDTVAVKILLLTKGEVGFWEVYHFGEIFNYLNEIEQASKTMLNTSESVDSNTVPETFFSYLAPNVQGNDLPSTNKSPVIGFANINDTALVNSILNNDSTSFRLPRDLNWNWSVKRQTDNYQGNTEILELYALKLRLVREPLLDEKYIAEVKAKNNEIKLTFNNEGARIWKKITSENLDKGIAFTLDNYVYSCPTVMNEIKDGRSQISGNFTIEEAKVLAAVISSGILPVNPVIKNLIVKQK